MKSIKYSLSCLILSSCLPAYGNNFLQYYGNISLAAEHIEEDDDREQYADRDYLQNKASRIGIHGEKQLPDNKGIFYRLEYGVNIVDKKNKDTIFLRDIYVGLQNEYGKIKLGYSNTPFKLAQGKVDVFNDILDLSTLLPGDNVESMLAVEATPVPGLKVNLSYLLNDNPDAPRNLRKGFSTSIGYRLDAFSAALAYERATNGQDLMRAAGNYQYNNWLLGFMYQKNRTNAYSEQQESGYLVSLKYHWDNMAVKFQAINSDFTQGTKSFYGISGKDAKSFALGLDYYFLDAATLMLYAARGQSDSSQEESQQDDINLLGLGMKVLF